MTVSLILIDPDRLEDEWMTPQFLLSYTIALLFRHLVLNLNNSGHLLLRTSAVSSVSPFA